VDQLWVLAQTAAGHSESALCGAGTRNFAQAVWLPVLALDAAVNNSKSRLMIS
jgi:hypothetical protein